MFDGRARVALLASMVVAGAVSADCRSRSRARAPAPAPAPAPVGIGFNLTDDPEIVRGAILTQPPGREEAFLGFVAGAAPGWISACRKKIGRSPLIFSFRTDEQGRLQTVPLPPDGKEGARCVAEKAASGAAEPLAAETEVTVQVTLRIRD